MLINQFFVLMIDLVNQLKYIEVKMLLNVEAMLKEWKYCNKIINENFNKEMILTKEDEENFKASNECHICNEKYDTNYKKKVRDHDHLTGKYMGSAHKKCNTKFY